jgi:hypothetical protein
MGHHQLDMNVLFSLLLLVALSARGAEHAPAYVSMVADLHGTVAVANTAWSKPEDRWPVQLLQRFPPSRVLTLENAARVTLFFPAEGIAFELRGPGKFEIAPDSVRPLSNAPPPSRSVLNAAFRGIKLDRSNLAPAGVRMRDPRPAGAPAPLEPRGIVMAADGLVFRWGAVGGGRQYRFRLARDRTDLIYEAVTEQTELVLPPEFLLTPGEPLLWQVEDASQARGGASGWQEFMLATPDAGILAAQIDRDLPSPNAAERNLREVLLLQRMPPGKSEP